MYGISNVRLLINYRYEHCETGKSLCRNLLQVQKYLLSTYVIKHIIFLQMSLFNHALLMKILSAASTMVFRTALVPILRSCHHDDGYINGQLQIKVHTAYGHRFTALGLPWGSTIQVVPYGSTEQLAWSQTRPTMFDITCKHYGY